jgi:hypothetical protein
MSVWGSNNENIFLFITHIYLRGQTTDKALGDAYVKMKGRDSDKNHERSSMEPYLITVKRPGEKPLVKTVDVDKNLSRDEIMALLRTEANNFINENVRNIEDLDGMSVHAEKAKDLTGDQYMIRIISGSGYAEIRGAVLSILACICMSWSD